MTWQRRLISYHEVTTDRVGAAVTNAISSGFDSPRLLGNNLASNNCRANLHWNGVVFQTLIFLFFILFGTNNHDCNTFKKTLGICRVLVCFLRGQCRVWWDRAKMFIFCNLVDIFYLYKLFIKKRANRSRQRRGGSQRCELEQQSIWHSFRLMAQH